MNPRIHCSNTRIFSKSRKGGISSCLRLGLQPLKRADRSARSFSMQNETCGLMRIRADRSACLSAGSVFHNPRTTDGEPEEFRPDRQILPPNHYAMPVERQDVGQDPSNVWNPTCGPNATSDLLFVCTKSV